MPPTLLRPLGFGEILDGAFMLYRRHFLTFFLAALIPTIPMSLVWVPMMRQVDNPETAGITLFVFLLLLLVASFVAWAALTRLSARAIEGHPPAICDGFRHGFRALLPLLGAMILAGLLFIPVVVVTMVPVIVIGAVVGEGGAALLGALYATGVMVMVTAGFAMLFAVPAAVVVERQGPWSALKRSWRLAQGARLRVLGMVLIAWVIITLPSLALYSAGWGAGLYTLSPDAPQSSTWLLIEASLGFLIGALTYPYLVSVMTLLYFDRRVRTEAYDLELAMEELAPAH